MAVAQEDTLASTRADRSSDLESMARYQEDYPAVDAYQTCYTMCTEANVVPAVESIVTIVTGAAPRARLSSSMEIVSGLLHHKTRTRQDKTNQC